MDHQKYCTLVTWECHSSSILGSLDVRCYRNKKFLFVLLLETMQLLEKILGNIGERYSKIVNLLDFKDGGETAFIFSLILHSCSQIDHCIYIYSSKRPDA